MGPLWIVALLAVGAEGGKAEGKAAAPKAEGKWLIVYAEEGGRRNNAWEQRVATFSGDTLSFEQEGKERSLRLMFGPDQTLKASGGEGGGKKEDGDKEAAPKSYRGVYIAGQDYLCLSLNPDAKGSGGDSGGKSSGAFILILRRQKSP